MFGFEYGTVHISNDDAYNDNNNVTKSIYQIQFSTRRACNGWSIVNIFKIIDNSMSKTSQNNMFMLGIFPYVVNETEHGVEVKQ